MIDDSPKKRGPKTPWSEALGLTKREGYCAPLPVLKLLHELPIKRLLNRLALDEKFKARTLAPFQDDKKKKS